MKALTIGRFQPLHKGHILMLEYVIKRVDELVIGVGSSNNSNELENPFSFEERVEMLNLSLKTDIPRRILPIPDMGDDTLWIKNIIENIEFDVFFTNAENEKRIFENQNIAVKPIPFFDRPEYSATNVREKILSDKSWEKLVPTGTETVIREVDGVQRIKNLEMI